MEKKRSRHHHCANRGAHPACCGAALRQGRRGKHHQQGTQRHLAPAQQGLLHGKQQRLSEQPTAQGNVDKVWPAVVGQFSGKLLLMPLAQNLGVFAGLAGGGHPVWWRDTVSAVPPRRIILQGLHQARQLVLETVLLLPAQQVAGAAGIECVVVVGHFGHEGPHERGLALVNGVGNDRFKPGLCQQPGSGEGFGHLQRCPVIDTVHQRTQAVLQRVVAHGVGLTDEDGCFTRQCAAAINNAAKGIQHVVAVQHRLADQGAARVKVTLQVALVDAGKLLGHCRHQRLLVIDTGQAQVDKGNGTVLLAHHLLGRGLGSGVGPARTDRVALNDSFARSAWRMNQHRAGIDKLFDLESLQRTQQVPCAIDIDALVARVISVTEIEVSHQMQHAGDLRTKRLTQLVQRQLDGCRRSKIGLQDRESAFLCLAVQSDYAVAVAQ